MHCRPVDASLPALLSEPANHRQVQTSTTRPKQILFNHIRILPDVPGPDRPQHVCAADSGLVHVRRHVRQLPERTHDLPPWSSSCPRPPCQADRRADHRATDAHPPPSTSSPRPTSPASSPAQTRPSGTHTHPRSSIPSGPRPEAACKTQRRLSTCCRSLSLYGFTPRIDKSRISGFRSTCSPNVRSLLSPRISPRPTLPRQTLLAPLCRREPVLESFRLSLGRGITRVLRAPLARLLLAPRQHRHDDGLQR